MIDEKLSSFKELQDVYLKATYPIDIKDYHFEEGETICRFDKIQIGGLSELREVVAARGGFDNRGLVYWETTKEIRLTFSQGVFSNIQFGILNNAKLIESSENEPVLITCTEEIECENGGYLPTKYTPYDQQFGYLKETGEKIPIYIIGDVLYAGPDYDEQEIIVHYRYNYTGKAAIAKIGKRCLQGYLELEGKTRVKDDMSGLITTGIIKIPKLKIMSGLSIRLGSQANPVVGSFEGVGVPVESRHNSYVAEFDFLSNDIDSDM